MEIGIGDVVQLKKTHPCGSNRWEVFTVGADVGIKCQQCHRRVLLPRAVFERKVKAILSRGGMSVVDTEANLS